MGNRSADDEEASQEEDGQEEDGDKRGAAAVGPREDVLQAAR